MRLPPSATLPAAFALALTGAFVSPSAAQEPASPKRPSFSTGSAVAAGGTLEIELGGQGSEDAFLLPLELRLGLGAWFPRTELSVALAPLDVAGGDARFGEKLTLGLRTRLFEPVGGPRIAFAPEVGIALRGGVPTTLAATMIVDRSFARHGVVGNARLEVPSRSESAAPDRTFTWIAGYSVALGTERRVSLAAEVQQILPEGQPARWSTLQALSYALRPHVVLDVAIQQDDLGGAGPTVWSVSAGIAMNVGRVLR